MVLSAIFFLDTPELAQFMVYPMAIGAVCLITSIIGTFFVKLGSNNSIMGALYRGFIRHGCTVDWWPGARQLSRVRRQG
jgi:K(+)-stimulated pyrophosphate-energized sodium pump